MRMRGKLMRASTMQLEGYRVQKAHKIKKKVINC